MLKLPKKKGSKKSETSPLDSGDEATTIKLQIPGNTTIEEVEEPISPQRPDKIDIPNHEQKEDSQDESDLENMERQPRQSILVMPVEKTSKAKLEAEVEDDDPYGLGTTSMKPTNFDQKELDAYQEKLMHEFHNEFKDSLSLVGNLPRGHIMLSAVKACLSDENKLVKRGILDMVNNFVK